MRSGHCVHGGFIWAGIQKLMRARVISSLLLLFALASPAFAAGRQAEGRPSLDRLLPEIRRHTPGTFYNAEGPFIGSDGQARYRIKWMTPEGRIIWFEVDAQRGHILGMVTGTLPVPSSRRGQGPEQRQRRSAPLEDSPRPARLAVRFGRERGKGPDADQHRFDGGPGPGLASCRRPRGQHRAGFEEADVGPLLRRGPGGGGSFRKRKSWRKLKRRKGAAFDRGFGS